MPNPVGAHIAVGKRRVYERVEALGAEAIQVFTGNPRGWAAPRADPAADDRLRQWCAERGIAVFIHAPYLINLGSPNPETAARSAGALRASLSRAADLGAVGVVVHAGSSVAGAREQALERVRATLIPILEDTEATGGPVQVLIEPTAGGGGALASDARSLGEYLDALDHDVRVGVCLDSCHMHAAGHDLGADFAGALQAYAAAAGRNRIGLVHANDSRDPCGSKRDRHAGLGAGTIGAEPFAALFTAPALTAVPIVVETEESGHAADIATLLGLRGRAGG